MLFSSKSPVCSPSQRAPKPMVLSPSLILCAMVQLAAVTSCAGNAFKWCWHQLRLISTVFREVLVGTVGDEKRFPKSLKQYMSG